MELERASSQAVGPGADTFFMLARARNPQFVPLMRRGIASPNLYMATRHPNVVTISGLAVGSFELTESALFERLFPKDLAKVIQ